MYNPLIIRIVVITIWVILTFLNINNIHKFRIIFIHFLKLYKTQLNDLLQFTTKHHWKYISCLVINDCCHRLVNVFIDTLLFPTMPCYIQTVAGTHSNEFNANNNNKKEWRWQRDLEREGARVRQWYFPWSC